MPPTVKLDPTLVPLCVPSWDESLVFSAGALYTPERGFYALADGFLDPLHDWLPLKWKQPSPVLMPEMLPITAWQKNLRFLTTPEQWDRYRRYCYKAAGYRCEICGSNGDPHLECHERWEFINRLNKRIQLLKGLITVCPICHRAHHLGFANSQGILAPVLEHIRTTNGWTAEQLNQALLNTEKVWKELSKAEWELDLTWLQTSGYIHA